MLARLRGWIRALARRNLVEREMQDEMRTHLDRATERLIARGLSATAARDQARREFGNIAYLQDEARDARGVRWIENAARDVRHALRGLRREPGFAIAVVCTLGLGIGANATMFGIVDRLLFRPPAYLVGPERSHHLYFVRTISGREQIGQASQYQRFLDLAELASSMDVIAGYAPRQLIVGSGDDAHTVGFGYASASLWRLFDLQPSIGRFFTAEEDRDPGAGGARVAVLSFGYWRSQYGGAADVIGRTILIWPNQYTIIGVAPRGFGGVELETPDVFIPMAVAAADDFGAEWVRERTGYSITWLEVYGRRKAGVPLEAATADLSAAYRASYLRQLAREPRSTAPIERARPRVILGSMLAERGQFGEILEQGASPSYFETMGTRIVRGRGLVPDDREGAPRVVVVSEGLARALWPAQDAIGQCMRTKSATAPCRTIVGIAEDVKIAHLGDAPSLVYYVPVAQSGEFEGRLLIRVHGAATRHSEAIRRDLQRVMPAASYLVVRPMASVLSSVTRSWRLGATLFAVFGALALVLASIGSYSVVAYGAAQRRHEVGVRIALGARVVDVVSLVVREGLRVVIVGIIAGIALALVGGRWIDPMLFHVSARDPLVIGTVAAMLIPVALAASGIPALRASRVDPTTALRSD